MMATCRIKKIFPWIECQRDAWEEDKDGLCLLHSRKEDKDKDGSFTDGVKKKLDEENYNFRGVFFSVSIDFSGKEFDKDADFSGAIFYKEAKYGSVSFNKKADFSDTTFIGNAIFTAATFIEIASFLNATFSMGTSFDHATFSKEVSFFCTNFLGETDFIDTTFYGEASFAGASFSKNTYLGGINKGELSNYKSDFFGDFRLVKLEAPGVLVFHDCSLARVIFSGTDLRRVSFHHVSWLTLKGRQAIYNEKGLMDEEKSRPWFWDWFLTWISCHLTLIMFALECGSVIPQYLSEEFPPPDTFLADDYGEVERLYRNLKLNYEEAGDFKNAGDFHYGEMEMHRRSSKWRWFPLYWYNLYKFSSGYGERPLRAFIWLLLLIPAWAGLVWGLGIDQAGSQNPVNYGDTLLFIFEKVTFQRPELPKGIPWLGKFLGSLSVLLLPGQAALFILALRNRLGRRR